MGRPREFARTKDIHDQIVRLEAGHQPAGKGATTQHFTASDGDDKLEIDTAPWGEGDLIINGKKRAHVENETSEQRAFADLKVLAEKIEEAGK